MSKNQMRQFILFLIIICKLKYCALNTTDKEGASASAAAQATSQCDEEMLAGFLAEMEITCPENIIQQSVLDLESFCRKGNEQLDKFRKFSSSCKIKDEQNLYVSLFGGLKTLQKKLCDSIEFLRRFKLYYPCLHELRNDFESCNAPVDWYEFKDETEVCNNYKYVTDCYYVKTAKVCGIDAAHTLKELTTDVINSIIKVKCNTVLNDPNVKDPMPENYLCGKAAAIKSPKIIIFLTFLWLYLT